MKIPTANVVVGFDREVMNELFATGATYSNLLKGITDTTVTESTPDGVTAQKINKDVLLFNKQNNPNFLSFKHTLLSEGSIFSLDIIDPTGEFEKRYLTADLTTILPNDTSFGGERKSPLTTSLLDGQKAKLTENDLQTKIGEYSKRFNQATGIKKIFIAYGVGSNLDLWSGPHVAILKGASINMDGARKITLEFVATNNHLSIGSRRGLYNESLENTIDLQGMTIEVNARSSNINFLDSSKKQYGKEHEQAFTKSAYGVPTEAAGNAFDIHLPVCDTIRSLVRNATSNENVIVLLPDLNKICYTALTEELNLAIIDKTPPSSSAGTTNSATLDDRKTLYSLGDDKKNLKSKAEAVASLFSLTLDSMLKDPMGEQRNFDPPTKQFLEETTDTASFRDRLTKFFAERDFFFTKTVTRTGGFPDYKVALKSIIDAIRGASKGEHFSDFSYFYETNTQLVELWSEEQFDGITLFGGHENTLDPDKPAIIIGDLGMIKDYLYGSEALSEGGEVSTYPIHPYDNVILSDKGYNERVRSVVFKPINTKGDFGDISYIPDEFSYTDASFSEEAKQEIRERQIPVLRYNTTNPNVLSLSNKTADVYLAQLTMGIQKENSRRASASLAGVMQTKYTDFEFYNTDAIIAYIRKRNLSLGAGDNKGIILKELSNKFKAHSEFTLADAEEQAAHAYALYEGILKLPGNPILKVDQLLPGNPVNIISDLAEQMYNMAYTVSVETLPMFHLSNINTLTKNIVLFAQDQDILQSVPPERSAINAFLTGYYKIFGFSHEISNTTIKSTFELVKIVMDPAIKLDDSESLELTS